MKPEGVLVFHTMANESMDLDLWPYTANLAVIDGIYGITAFGPPVTWKPDEFSWGTKKHPYYEGLFPLNDRGEGYSMSLYSNWGSVAEFAFPSLGGDLAYDPEDWPSSPVTVSCGREGGVTKADAELMKWGHGGAIIAGSGTSYATGLASVCAARILSILRRGSPRNENTAVADMEATIDIMQTAARDQLGPDPLKDVEGPDPYYGKGIIDMTRAENEAKLRS